MSSRPTARADQALAAALLLTAALGCDRGVPAEPPAAGAVQLIDASVGPARPLRRGQAIALSFDRYLDPRTASRQSFALLDRPGAIFSNPVVQYEPVTRTVWLISPGDDQWARPGQPYGLQLGRPALDQFYGGVRALDGAPLRDDAPSQIAFMAREDEGAPAGAARPRVDYCETIQPLFNAHCTSCHDGQRSGLDLRSGDAVQRTALGVPARVAMSGAQPQPQPMRGGALDDLARIEPRNPGGSYLLWSTLARELDEEPTPARERMQDPRITELWFQREVEPSVREQLQDALGGQAMPPSGRALGFSERLSLSDWILQGASVHACAGANDPPPP